jgi:hypothetical protein
MGDNVLGYIWRETESDGWQGVWTRIGDTNEFHAQFKHRSGQEIVGQLRMERNGHNLRIHRWNPVAPGTCEYEGAFSADFKTAAGIYYCFDQSGQRIPPSGSYGWSATIS